MMHRKTQLAAAVGAALLLGATAVQAQNLTVQLYGQVNRALMYADNETQSKWFHVDGQPSSTRFGIQGTAQVMPGLRAGARIESEMKSNPSDVVTFADASTGALGGGAVGFAERWLDAWFEGAWGRVNLGQGSGAADDASTIDLSGTGLANGSCLCDWGGNIPFTTSAGAVVAGATPATTLNNNDFESRYDRAMYTTPLFGGFKAQVGFGQKSDAGETREASIWYTGKLAGDLQAAFGRSTEKTGNAAGVGHNVTMGGSVGWLHTSGFNLAYNYTTAKLSVAPARDAKYHFVKAGYKFGQHAIAVALAKGDDQAAANDEAKAWSLGYVWTPVRWTEVYTSYIVHSLDRTGVDVNDIKTAQVGTRIRF